MQSHPPKGSIQYTLNSRMPAEQKVSRLYIAILKTHGYAKMTPTAIEKVVKGNIRSFILMNDWVDAYEWENIQQAVGESYTDEVVVILEEVFRLEELAAAIKAIQTARNNSTLADLEPRYQQLEILLENHKTRIYQQLIQLVTDNLHEFIRLN